MSDILITYQDHISQRPLTKQLSGDYVGARYEAGFVIVGSARNVVKTRDAGTEEEYTYQDQEGIEEFHIPDRAVYCLQINHGPYNPLGAEVYAERIKESLANVPENTTMQEVHPDGVEIRFENPSEDDVEANEEAE